ncbi:MAG: hypothetical protein ACK2UO_00850 [Caldilineaceae bacterium]
MSHMLSWSKTVPETTPERWRRLTQTLPAALLTRTPTAGEWSAPECLQPIADHIAGSGE